MDHVKKLYIEPSSACNLKCSMCFRNLWYDEKNLNMSPDICDAVIRAAKKFKGDTAVFGGMGEPLLNPHIFRMINAYANHGVHCEIITNATLLDRENAKKLSESGISRVWISMDAFSLEEYEKIRLGSRFELIMKNIESFNEIRRGTDIKLAITFVVMKENEESLNHINEFADKIGAEMINISHAIPCEAINESDCLYDRDFPVGRMKRFGEGFEEHKPEVCPFVSSDAMFIRCDGDAAPCMQLLHNCHTYLYELKRKIYRVSYGNILNNEIDEIYNLEEYRQFRSRVSEFHFSNCTGCTTGCPLREDNLEDCMLNEKPTCGACLWSTGKIFCP